MKTTQINIAIAKACGMPEPFYGTDKMQFGGGPQPGTWTGNIPDYCGSLDAMHEAEKTLTPAQWNQFSHNIEAIARHEMDSWFPNWRELNPSRVIDVAIIHASAAQRAKAFLKTIGKWQPQPDARHQGAGGEMNL